MDEVIISINFEGYALLDKANSFSEIPERLKNYFRETGLNLRGEVAVFKDVKYPRWYVIDGSKQFLNIFYMELDKVNNSSADIKIARKTPTHSDNIHDYPIYRVGISFKKDQILFISGQEREELNDLRKQQKWDYFFRASPEMVGHQHRFLADIFGEWKKAYQQKLVNAGWKAGLIVVASIFLLANVWKYLAIAAIFFGIYRFRHIFLAIYNTYFKIQALQKYIDRLDQERVMLESQIEQTTVSGAQMRQWLKEEIDKLDEQSALELGLPSDKILRQSVRDGHIKIDPNNQTTGLMVKEWGLTQPLTTNGKAMIEKRHWHHLRAYRYNDGRPLVGVYYLHFIYMTPQTVGFCGFFYDFILAKRFGTYTQQLFYRDIVNIGAKEEETKVLSDQEEWQTKQIIMSFTNGERISIALTDAVAIENLREQIEKGSDTDKLSEMSVEALPGTRANFILNSVKTYWNEKKGMKFPPQEDLLP